MTRCAWAGPDQIYIDYHDHEWGVAEYDSRALWEKLILEGYQAGLSWITILKKRENFRAAFAGFEPKEIATWGEDRVELLVQNAGIIRHRGKINATIGNAKAYLEIEAEQGFSNYIWGFVNHTPIIHGFSQLGEVPNSDAIAIAMSKDLKKRGFKFCGPTILYAFMQAAGLVNDHVTTCPQHPNNR